MIQSHDPRMNRLGLSDAPAAAVAKEALDQFGTYEVFHQKKEGAPYVYVGPVHAPEADVAFLFAKEQYSRRFACTGLWVVPTAAITVTAYVGDQESAYDTLPLVTSHKEPAPDASSPGTSAPAAERTVVEAGEAGETDYDIFHLKKRGKAHQHVGQVRASSPGHALQVAKAAFGEQRPVVNVWAARSADFLRSDAEDRDIWATTPEKKYRDAIAYKVQDRIEKFKAENS
ncbi:phenylacetic acid degradation b [Hymenobacter sp. BT664]|uniref:Phenylacetic acid degradation b n=1 Tax=Hymenobacter montanus TaxID=2771359 RepID=A0A927BBE6_9BACT|nr:phenylacetic acid degradation b [Hymenobacter montanus]MBD2767660.1 phenylacetic acid degradation b [Hymenobacter montanus]